MTKLFLAWYITSTLISYILPWTPLQTTHSLNLFTEFPVRIWYADATKVSRINYSHDNKDGISESFIIRSEDDIQIGQPGKS